MFHVFVIFPDLLKPESITTTCGQHVDESSEGQSTRRLMSTTQSCAIVVPAESLGVPGRTTVQCPTCGGSEQCTLCSAPAGPALQCAVLCPYLVGRALLRTAACKNCLLAVSMNSKRVVNQRSRPPLSCQHVARNCPQVLNKISQLEEKREQHAHKRL